jgi:hypothetical protein
MLHVRHAAIEVSHHMRPIERGPDVAIHRPGRVDVTHPVVAIRLHPEIREQVDEHLRVVSGVRGVPVPDLVGDVGERHAHRALDGVRRQERLGVHRVEVVDAVQQGRGMAGRAQRAGDDVEDDRPAEAPDVDRARWGLRVIDDLRSGDPRRELVRPYRRTDG